MNKEGLEREFTILRSKLTCLIDCKLIFDSYLKDGNTEKFASYLNTEIEAYKNMYKNVQEQLENKK